MPASRILAVSFTNKASKEMGERMAALIGRDKAEKLWLSTFHSFGVRFLGEENRALGFDGRFVIFDQGDSLGVVRDILREEHLGDRNLDIPAVLTRISLWKNAFTMPEQVKESDFEYDAVAREVYPKYEERLAAMHAVDFDDLVVAPVKILKEHEDVRAKWRERFHFLLVDEFQDTNRSQLELVRSLASDGNDVCVVGDDDQSIYSWRGAEVSNILDFERFFPGATVIKLETNYRSRSPILEVANAVIAQSRARRHRKTLRSAKGAGPKVRLVALSDAAAEAKFVISELRQLNAGEATESGRRFKWGDMAVLYRSNQQAKILEEELRLAGVPYQLFGGTQFFDRKEVKDVIAYLRVVDNPRDELSLRRSINTPPRGVGDGSLMKARTQALAKNTSLERALRSDEVDLSAAARRGVDVYFEGIDAARQGLKTQDLTAVTTRLLEDVGFTRALTDDPSNHGKRRRENVEFLMRAIKRFSEDRRSAKPTLGQFLTRITLRVDQEEEQDVSNKVTLSSLHSSKGLEFPVVILIGCVEGTIPHSRTTDPKLTEAAPSDVDEERRLFYVGVTRAQELLYLSRPERRTMRGKVGPRFPSRFLEGLPEGAWETYRPAGEETMASEDIASMAEALMARLRG